MERSLEYSNFETHRLYLSISRCKGRVVVILVNPQMPRRHPAVMNSIHFLTALLHFTIQIYDRRYHTVLEVSSVVWAVVLQRMVQTNTSLRCLRLLFFDGN
jgi:hypothetical protein